MASKFLSGLAEVFGAEVVEGAELGGPVGALAALLVAGEEQKAEQAIANIRAIIIRTSRTGEERERAEEHLDDFITNPSPTTGIAGGQKIFDDEGFEINPLTGERTGERREGKEEKEGKGPEDVRPADEQFVDQLIDDFKKDPSLSQSGKEQTLLQGLADLLARGVVIGGALRDRLFQFGTTFGGPQLRGKIRDKIESGAPTPSPTPTPPGPGALPEGKDGKETERDPETKRPPETKDPDEDPDPVEKAKRSEPGQVVNPILVGLLRPEFYKAGANSVKESRVDTLQDKKAFDEFDEDLRTNPNESSKEFENPLRDAQLLENSLRFTGARLPSKPKRPKAKSRFRRLDAKRSLRHRDQHPRLNEPFRFYPS